MIYLYMFVKIMLISIAISFIANISSVMLYKKTAFETSFKGFCFPNVLKAIAYTSTYIVIFMLAYACICFLFLLG